MKLDNHFEGADTATLTVTLFTSLFLLESVGATRLRLVHMALRYEIRIRSQLSVCSGRRITITIRLSAIEENTTPNLLICPNIFYKLTMKPSQEMKMEHE
jgi:hypothetical protein